MNSRCNRRALREERITRLRREQDRLQLMNDAIGDQRRSPQRYVVPGEWVPESTTRAKVAQPGKLNAVLRIPESQAAGSLRAGVLKGARTILNGMYDVAVHWRVDIWRGTLQRWLLPQAQGSTAESDV